MNNARSEMITFIPCLALYCKFPPWFIQCIWDISTPTFHKPHDFIQAVFILIPIIISSQSYDYEHNLIF